MEVRRQPLTATPHAGALDLSPVGLDARRSRATSRRARLALAGLLASGLAIALAAAHTAPLLPESVRLGLPVSLGGAFYGVGLNLHVAGVMAALALMFVSYATVVGASDKLSGRALLMTIAALDAIVLLGPPLVSTDIFSYQAYARMGAVYATNPYTHGPHAIFLDQVFPYVGAKWAYIPSAYGPVFTVFTYLLAPLSIVASVFAYKSLAALAGAGLVALVWQCARLRGKNPVRAAAIVGCNPLLAVYGIGGGHNDLLMLLVLVGGLYAILASRERVGGGLMILAVGIKLTAGVVFPFAVAAGGPRRGRPRRELLLSAGVAVAGICALSLELFGTGTLNMLGAINKSQSEGGWQSIPGFIGGRLGMPGVGHVIGFVMAGIFVLIGGWMLRRVWRGRTDWIDGAGWSTLAMLVASSSLLPWYVCWLLPLAALGHDRRLARMAIVLTGAVQAVQVLGYIPHGGGTL